MHQEGQVMDFWSSRIGTQRRRSGFQEAFSEGDGLVTADCSGRYAAALRRLAASFEHVKDKGGNDDAENSHLPTRERDRR